MRAGWGEETVEFESLFLTKYTCFVRVVEVPLLLRVAHDRAAIQCESAERTDFVYVCAAPAVFFSAPVVAVGESHPVFFGVLSAAALFPAVIVGKLVVVPDLLVR